MTVIVGDAFEIPLPDNSVDSVITDPPYGLTSKGGSGGFMGKRWDDLGYGEKQQAWHLEWAKEALRVLKPGGHLLAFGGARTYHRLACAVEDAGFEIRDMVEWHYGSGFPKNHDVAKAIDQQSLDEPTHKEARVRLAEEIREKREAVGVSRQEMGSWFPHHEYVHQNWERTDDGFRVPNEDDYNVLVERLGISEDHRKFVRAEDKRKLLADDLTDRRDDGTVIGLGLSGKDWAPSTALAKTWEGWGTALKPSHEPIVLARKPLVGTVAENVLEHGAGALNIDDCRIATVEDTRRTFDLERTDTHEGWDRPWMQEGERTTGGHSGGRWPANTVLTHHPDCQPAGWKRVGSKTNTERDGEPTKNQRYTEEGGTNIAAKPGKRRGEEVVTKWDCASGCPVKELDHQSGDLSKSPTNRNKPMKDQPLYGEGLGTYENVTGYGDNGGASRFFYTSKASRAEREAGLDHLKETRHYRWNKGGEFQNIEDDIANHHPTVKPVDLMRWLVRLVTPPEGTVLDPFTGSGTTGIACVLEDFDFIGIEKNSEYLDIARARIHNAETNPDDYVDDQETIERVKGTKKITDFIEE